METNLFLFPQARQALQLLAQTNREYLQTSE